MKKLSDEAIEKILTNTKATLAMEDLYVTDKEEDIGRKFLKGEISKDEATKIITRDYPGYFAKIIKSQGSFLCPPYQNEESCVSIQLQSS